MPASPDPTGPAVVLLSGGLDSAVALAAARRDGFDCFALTIDYGQRHRQELAAAKRVARSLGARDHRVVLIDLRAIGGSALTGRGEVPKDRDIPRSDPSLTPDIPATYVPARNSVFLSIAAGYAEVVGASHVFIGANAVDYSGYPDCRPAFIEAMERALTLGTKAGIEGKAFGVHAPLIHMSKAEIIRLGASLGVDFSLTHSCYDPPTPADNGAACGRCDACILRRRGFEEAGVPDPTRYAPAVVTRKRQRVTK